MVTQFSVTLLLSQTKLMLKNKLGPKKNPKVFYDLDSFKNNLRIKIACIRIIWTLI